MKFLEYLKNNILYLDGGMGTLLQAEGLQPGEHPERWNYEHPEVIVKLQKMYFDAGTNLIISNTFGANVLHFELEELDKIVKHALENARTAAAESTGKQEKFVALDIGPTGRPLKPYGDFDFEECVAVFAETVKLGVKYGADAIFIETIKLFLCIEKNIKRDLTVDIKNFREKSAFITAITNYTELERCQFAPPVVLTVIKKYRFRFGRLNNLIQYNLYRLVSFIQDHRHSPFLL